MCGTKKKNRFWKKLYQPPGPHTSCTYFESNRFPWLRHMFLLGNWHNISGIEWQIASITFLPYDRFESQNITPVTYFLFFSNFT